MERLADGVLQFREPNGWLIPDAPEPPEVLADGGETLGRENAAMGVHVDATGLLPDWDGTRVNLGWAISVMHPRANGGH